MIKVGSIKHPLIYCLAAIISILLLIYVVLKAHATSFTHDESFTYLNYVHEPFMDIISYKHPYTNNHILNTVLIKYSEGLFGNSELALRLPNIIACFMYLIYCFKLLKRISLVLLIPCFISLLCNTMLIDFFSLARGYGLSFAFMLMSLYHLIEHFKTNQRKDLILFNAGAFFAVLSNFSLLNYYVAALITYNLLKLIDGRFAKDSSEKKFRFYSLNSIHLFSLAIFTAVLYEPLRRISKQGMLDFGGKTGFLEDTFGSIIKGVSYETAIPPGIYGGLLVSLVILLLLITFLIVKHLYKKDELFFEQHRSLVVVYFILLGIIALSLIQHFVIYNDFYTGRFALFIYPLLMLNFAFYSHYVFQKHVKWLPLILSILLSVLLMLNFLGNINLRFYQEWKYDSGTKTVLNILTKEYEQHPRQITLGINWLFEPTTNFYRYTHHLTWLTKADRKGLKTQDDYYYLFESDTNAYRAKGKTVLFSVEGVNTLLVKNKE